MVTTPSAAEYRTIGEQIDSNLWQQVLAKWFPASINAAGGFHQNFREDWSPGGSDGYGIVYQSRLTWVSSQIANLYPNHKSEYLAYADHGLSFLENTMWDSKYGGFYWSVNDSLVPNDDGRKHAYGISFAIYAASAEYQTTRSAKALKLAQDAFHWLDSKAHDKLHGGYYEALTRQGVPIVDPVGSVSSDQIGTHFGYKSMNTHIHLLESFTALYRIWPDATLRTRLKELYDIVSTKIAVQKLGALNLYFTPDWQAIPGPDSYGHDVETAYLLCEAADALGFGNDEKVWAFSRKIVDHALEVGWDKANAGFYDSGPSYGDPYAAEKVWWVQAEGLNALLLMHEHYGKSTDNYWNSFLKLWDFVQSKQVDQHNGGWQNSVKTNGESLPGAAKSDSWTDPYHQGRALMNVESMLKQLAN